MHSPLKKRIPHLLLACVILLPLSLPAMANHHDGNDTTLVSLKSKSMNALLSKRKLDQKLKALVKETARTLIRLSDQDREIALSTLAQDLIAAFNPPIHYDGRVNQGLYRLQSDSLEQRMQAMEVYLLIQKLEYDLWQQNNDIAGIPTSIGMISAMVGIGYFTHSIPMAIWGGLLGGFGSSAASFVAIKMHAKMAIARFFKEFDYVLMDQLPAEYAQAYQDAIGKKRAKYNARSQFLHKLIENEFESVCALLLTNESNGAKLLLKNAPPKLLKPSR